MTHGDLIVDGVTHDGLAVDGVAPHLIIHLRQAAGYTARLVPSSSIDEVARCNLRAAADQLLEITTANVDIAIAVRPYVMYIDRYARPCNLAFSHPAPA